MVVVTMMYLTWALGSTSDGHVLITTLKSTETRNSKMSELKKAGQKAGLAEQRSILGGKRKGVATGSLVRQCGRTTEVLLAVVERKFMWPDLNGS